MAKRLSKRVSDQSTYGKRINKEIVYLMNPSLNYGSILTMRVVGVKEDYDDLTLSVPLNVLALFGADFDGDVMNVISIKTNEFRDYYNKLFNPRLMMIDRNDGKFNRKMNLIKDQMIGLYSFCKE